MEEEKITLTKKEFDTLAKPIRSFNVWFKIILMILLLIAFVFTMYQVTKLNKEGFICLQEKANPRLAYQRNINNIENAKLEFKLPNITNSSIISDPKFTGE